MGAGAFGGCVLGEHKESPCEPIFQFHRSHLVMSDSRYRIAIGADHGGVELKDAIARQLMAQGHEVADYGTHSKDSVDYADFANEVAIEVSQEQFDCGILCCTSGVGVSMAANRFCRCPCSESSECGRHEGCS